LYSFFMNSSFWIIAGVLVFFTVKLSWLQYLNIVDGADDRVTYFLSFIIVGLITSVNVGLVFFRFIPLAYMGQMTLFFCFIIFLMESLIARALGYPSMKTTKFQRVSLISGATLFGMISMTSLFIFFINTPKTGSYFPEVVTQIDFYRIYRQMLISVKFGDENFLLCFFTMILPSVLMMIMMINYDLKEKRSKRTIICDFLIALVLMMILIESFIPLLLWWFPFLGVLVFYSVVMISLLKEIQSMTRRMKAISPSISIIDKTIMSLSKKIDNFKEIDEFQVGIISRKCIEDQVLNNYLKTRRVNPKERVVLEKIWCEKNNILKEKEKNEFY